MSSYFIALRCLTDLGEERGWGKKKSGGFDLLYIDGFLWFFLLLLYIFLFFLNFVNIQ